MSKKTSEWEKEFDRKFEEAGCGLCVKETEEAKEVIKSFISDLLAKEKEELIERIEGMKKEGQLRDVPTDRGTGGINYGLTTPTRVLSLNDKLYNQALDDVLSALKSEIQVECRCSKKPGAYSRICLAHPKGKEVGE